VVWNLCKSDHFGFDFNLPELEPEHDKPETELNKNPSKSALIVIRIYLCLNM